MKTGDQTDRFFALVTQDGHLSMVADNLTEAKRLRGACTDAGYFTIHHVTLTLGEDIDAEERRRALWEPVKKARKVRA
jgi:hypothetical protein